MQLDPPLHWLPQPCQPSGKSPRAKAQYEEHHLTALPACHGPHQVPRMLQTRRCKRLNDPRIKTVGSLPFTANKQSSLFARVICPSPSPAYLVVGYHICSMWSLHGHQPESPCFNHQQRFFWLVGTHHMANKHDSGLASCQTGYEQSPQLSSLDT